MSQKTLGLFLFSQLICAYFSPSALLADASILQSEPQLHALYQKPIELLEDSERWEIHKHGLRMAPLDRRIWGARYFDKLDNRYLVSIRPYYLRLSEKPGVRIQEVELEFSFDHADYQQMKIQPHTHAPILEIGFAGALVPGLPGRRLQLDQGYAARLSGHFEFHSGILFRSHQKSVFVAAGKEPVLHVSHDYKAKLSIGSESATLTLDGEEFATIKGKNLDQGLLSLTVGWHPVRVSALQVRGTKQVDGKTVPFEVSGLHNVD